MEMLCVWTQKEGEARRTVMNGVRYDPNIFIFYQNNNILVNVFTF